MIKVLHRGQRPSRLWSDLSRGLALLVFLGIITYGVVEAMAEPVKAAVMAWPASDTTPRTLQK